LRHEAYSMFWLGCNVTTQKEGDERVGIIASMLPAKMFVNCENAKEEIKPFSFAAFCVSESEWYGWVSFISDTGCLVNKEIIDFILVAESNKHLIKSYEIIGCGQLN